MQAEHEYLFKILLIGETGVGKTQLLNRYADNSFIDRHLSTIGIDFKLKRIEVNSKRVKLQLWDTAGQERFRTITNTYFSGCHGIIIVYDITSKKSFENVQNWVKQVREYAGEKVVHYLIGNKSDQLEARQVTYDEGLSLAQSLGFEFMESSAKDSINVEKLFIGIATQLITTIEEVKEPIQQIEQSEPQDTPQIDSNLQGEYDYYFKLLLVGDSGVGKSQILNRYLNNSFSNDSIQTIGIDFKVKTIELNSLRVKIQSLDTSGQERFRSITNTFYKAAHGIIVMYDITSRQSFQNVENWVKSVLEYANVKVIQFLVGNKSDLNEARQVSYEEGLGLAQSLGFGFMETSAKDSNNVEISALITPTGIEMNQIQQLQQGDTVNCVVLGISGVGKKTICHMISQDIFGGIVLKTSGLQLNVKTIDLDNEILKQQANYSQMLESTCKNSTAIVLVYSVNDVNSFNAIQQWLEVYHVKVSKSCLIIGNKTDKDRLVDTEVGCGLSNQYGTQFVELYAGNSGDIEKAFNSLVDLLIQK